MTMRAQAPHHRLGYRSSVDLFSSRDLSMTRAIRHRASHQHACQLPTRTVKSHCTIRSEMVRGFLRPLVLLVKEYVKGALLRWAEWLRSQFEG